MKELEQYLSQSIVHVQ